MDNFSAIASLVLFGLFLITCPTEGFVTGYRYIDLSELRLHSSPIKRQGNPSHMDTQTSIDSEKIMFDHEHREIPSTEIFHQYRDNPEDGETLAGPEVDEEQYQETIKFKDGQLNNEPQNNENDINAVNKI